MTVSDTPPIDPTTHAQTVALVIGVVQAVIGLVLWSVAKNYSGVQGVAGVHVPLATVYLAASLFVAAAGLIAAGIVPYRRFGEAQPPTDAEIGSPPESRGVAAIPFIRVENHVAWAQLFVILLLAGLAIAAAASAWRLELEAPLGARLLQVFGGLAIVLAFPFVVLERFYAAMPVHVFPDARRVERLLRVPLASFVGVGVASLLLSVGFVWPLWIDKAIALLIGLVAIELGLRCAAIAFVPFDGTRSIADSSIAGLLRFTPPSVQALGRGMKQQFGIDLSRSWALAFVRSAALPITLGMIAFAWCLTGVTALGINERAIYERFGIPVAVLGPGLHLHWPWPFGVMRPVELGVVHEIPIVFAGPGAASEAGSAPLTARQGDTIEGPAPASADRLWNEAHPSEASYLVASESQGQQSFQIVNVDLRIVYRIGLTDTAAKDAAYAISDPESLLRALSGQLLARYFARYTLLDVLGQSRERFTNDFRTALQNALQTLPTGIEVIAVVVEAIHPPPAAAGAYHAVQAAEINAQSEISLQRANAVAKEKSAEQTATQGLDDATAHAAEMVEQAQAQDVLFGGDSEAYARDGHVFLLERWLERLANVLPRSSFMIIDHRLKGAAAPTIDFRSFSLPGANYQYAPQAPSTRGPAPSGTPTPPSGDEQESDGD